MIKVERRATTNKQEANSFYFHFQHSLTAFFFVSPEMSSRIVFIWWLKQAAPLSSLMMMGSRLNRSLMLLQFSIAVQTSAQVKRLIKIAWKTFWLLTCESPLIFESFLVCASRWMIRRVEWKFSVRKLFLDPHSRSNNFFISFLSKLITQRFCAICFAVS